MITTANLGLIVWDTEEDEFEHSQLAGNFVSIDEHNHEGTVEPAPEKVTDEPVAAKFVAIGKGKGIGTKAILPEAIWRYLIALRAVGHLQIGTQQVWRENIKDKAVANGQVDDEAIDTRTLKEHTVTIDKLDPNILTLGTVVQWYKWSIGATPGDLWAVMDGTAWANIPNDMGLSTGRIPDTREKFLRGATTLSKSDGSEIGGNPAVNLTHDHTLSSGQFEHTHVVSGHTHIIEGAGFHHHTYAGGFAMHTRSNAFIMGLLFEDTTKHLRKNTLESLYVAAPFFEHDGEPPGFESDEVVTMDEAGFHTHGGGHTNLSAAFNTSGSSQGGAVTIETSKGLEGVDTTPPFIGFVNIMLVRNKGT